MINFQNFFSQMIIFLMLIQITKCFLQCVEMFKSFYNLLQSNLYFQFVDCLLKIISIFKSQQKNVAFIFKRIYSQFLPVQGQKLLKMNQFWLEEGLLSQASQTQIHNNKMEANSQTQTSLQLFPRQKKGIVTQPSNCRATDFYSNIYKLTLKSEVSVDIYQYVFDISPELPTDSDGLIEKISKTLSYDLKKSIGLLTYRGMMAWGTKYCPTVLSLKAEFQRDKVKHSYDVLVKHTKNISFEKFFLENSDAPTSALQVLNISLKNVLRKEKFIQLTRGSYFRNDTIDKNHAQGRLNVWKGINVTAAIYNRSLYLQIDPCNRILRDESFLSTLEAERGRIDANQINLKYKGHSVLRRYGSPILYKIEEIDFNQSPKNSFINEKEGTKITYIEYYKKVYGVTIKSEKQPLLKVLADRKTNKNLKEGQKKYIYLVPELVCLTGLSDDQRGDFRIMQDLAKFTKLKADVRVKESENMINILNKDEELIFDIEKIPRAIKGFTYKNPQIMLGKKREANIHNGTINLRDEVLDPYQFKELVFCYSVGKNTDQDRAQADDAFGLLNKAGHSFGIKFKQPIWVQVDKPFNLQGWQSKLLDEKKKNKNKIDMVFFFVKPQEEKLYGDLKKFVVENLDCPSQFSRRKMLEINKKGNMSVASKLAMQMNAKMGRALWKIENTHQKWRQQSVAMAGIASSKGKRGVNLAFVGTTDKLLTEFYSDCKVTNTRQSLSTALFQTFFTQWIQNWFKKNEKKLPQVLVIYREGLNETQAKFQLDIEILAIKETIQKVRGKAQQPNYNPTIVYLLVNKKPNSRIFEGEEKGKERQYFNPTPGSIIFEGLSQGYKEFLLASAFVREGTCTPVSFKVGYENKPEFPLEAISQLTYNQCYAYFNWTGSVRVPAPLQYANKFAKLYSQIGDDLKTQGKGSDIKSTLHFL